MVEMTKCPQCGEEIPHYEWEPVNLVRKDTCCSPIRGVEISCPVCKKVISVMPFPTGMEEKIKK